MSADRPKRILIATHNAGKLKEFAALLAPLGIEAVGAGAMGLAEPAESADDFAGNARLKALAAARAAGIAALADDSGLCVAALGGGPGVFSARYAAGDYGAAFTRIIAACAAAGEWRARFVCALCLAQPDGTTATFIGQADGMIAREAGGAGGFGYDPVFVPDGYEKTYAELGSAVKDAISHRARAFAQVAARLAGSAVAGRAVGG
ncbi:RdgB/HAM1 family non-canonical purine NTP pyrophosphatase [Acidocella sp.]|uniref:RdgB/HAM1 family non-canonical purine NTP pyrophosphatase n=1 Tax=Acidocella sp. TaxID=50710 RepID=UPI00260218CE|nr:RdgB/HAM1 family non-canonical purine NTP pyrophosphatase [Acidocella sp.]MDD2794244.1 RdgB/HAM1 family non-canonical purine NTP pyrophosphatase [Acidocella sp.]